MDKRALADELLAEFGKTLTVGTLEFDADYNTCVLVFDDNLMLNFEFDEPTGRIVLSAYLAEIPTTGCETLLRGLLNANLYWHKTKGATLCLEEGTNGVILLYAHPVVDLTSAGFEAVVENFVNQCYVWRKRVGEGVAAATPTDDLNVGSDPNTINFTV